MIIINLKKLMVEKGAREGRRVSLLEISKAIGIGTSTLSRIANRPGYNIKKEYIESLCKFFEITPDELMTIIPDDSKQQESPRAQEA